MKNNINIIINLIEENKIQIENAINKDNKDYKIDFEKVINIIKLYENCKPQNKNEKLIVFTNGNLYALIILCMNALWQNKRIVLCNQNVMTNASIEIIRLFNTVAKKINFTLIKEYKLRDLVHDIEENSKQRIIVIDDKLKYKEFLKLDLPVEYKSYFSLDVYYDSEDYSNMINIVEDYSEKYLINTYIYQNRTITETLLRTNKEESSLSILILTQDVEKYNAMEQKFKNKNIFINYNPFDNYEEKVCEKIIKNM